MTVVTLMIHQYRENHLMLQKNFHLNFNKKKFNKNWSFLLKLHQVGLETNFTYISSTGKGNVQNSQVQFQFTEEQAEADNRSF